MCTFHERILELSKQKGISGSRACLNLGLSKSTLSDIKSGRKKSVSVETAQKFADYFGVTVGYLLGTEEKKPTVTDGQKENLDQPELTEGEKELLALYRTVPEEYQSLVLAKIRAAVELLGG